jgi:hypothetical protein
VYLEAPVKIILGPIGCGGQVYKLALTLIDLQLLLALFPLALHLIAALFQALGQHRCHLLAKLVHGQLREHLGSLVSHRGVVIAPDFPMRRDKTGQHLDEHLLALGVLEKQADGVAHIDELLP